MINQQEQKAERNYDYLHGYVNGFLMGGILGIIMAVYCLSPNHRNSHPPAPQQIEEEQTEETHQHPFTQSELPDKLKDKELRLK